MQLITGLACLALAVAAHAQGDFTTIMTAQDRAAAGLDKLTPEELARLKVVVERYKAGEVAVAQERAAQEVAAVREEAQQSVREAAVAAENRVAAAKAEVAKEREAEPGPKKPGWLKALVTLQDVADKPEEQEAFESRLNSEFVGWRKNTTFTLDDGSRWQVIAENDYVSPARPAPRVKIRPGMLGSYWMEIEGVRTRVKVKPLKL